MADDQHPKPSTTGNVPPPPPPSSSSNSTLSKSTPEISNSNAKFAGQKVCYRNPPELTNPDAATLREQWRFAIKQYSRWYSHAWGTAIVAGLSFFALGWIVKGSNPLPSFRTDSPHDQSSSSSSPSEVPRR